MPLTFNLVLNIHLQPTIDILDVKQVNIQKLIFLNKIYFNLMQFFFHFSSSNLAKAFFMVKGKWLSHLL